MRRFVAVTLLLSAIFYIASFPVIPVVLLAICVGYVVVLWFMPNAWLLVLPVALPVLDLAPWSGRFLLDEFDVLVGLTLAAALVRDDSAAIAQRPRLNAAFWWVGGLLMTSYLISFGVGFFPVQQLDGNAWLGYHTHWNALRVGKGFAEGFALALLLARQRAGAPDATDALLLRGLVAGLFAFGCVVLWERGVLSDLIHANNIYGALSGLLDFSSKYRITGLFSQMHLGGAAVDGYLVLCSIFPLVLLLKSRHWLEHGGTYLVLAMTMYAVLVTFTRGTYAAVFLSGLIFLTLLFLNGYKREVPGLSDWWLYLGLLLLGLIIMRAGFNRGGSVTLFAMSIAIMGGGAFIWARSYMPIGVRLICLAIGTVVVIFLSIRGIIYSKYSNVGTIEVVLVGALGVAALLLVSMAVFRKLHHHFSLRINFTALLALALVLPVIVVGLGNTRMGIRFDQVDKDLAGRINHWKDGYGLMPSFLGNQLFGVGLGGFPLAYLLGKDEKKPSGNVWFSNESEQAFLKLGGGSQSLGQRIQSSVKDPIELVYEMRPDTGKGRINFRLCLRPMLVQDIWIPKCSNPKRIQVHEDNKWREYRVHFDTNNFSQRQWYAPGFLLLSLNNTADNTIVDIKGLSMIDGDGRRLLQNGDFSAGGDRWLLFNDFDHLAWHAKNLYLHLYLEQGVWGLLVFALTVFCSLRLALRQSLHGDVLAMGVFASTMGFLALGLVATLFDVPRLVTLFYLLLLLPLIKDWQVVGRHRRRRKSSKNHPSGNGREKLEHDTEFT